MRGPQRDLGRRYAETLRRELLGRGRSAIEANDDTSNSPTWGQWDTWIFDEKRRGFEVAVVGNLSRSVGVMGDFPAHFSLKQLPVPFTSCANPPCSSVTQPGSINPRLFSLLAGQS